MLAVSQNVMPSSSACWKIGAASSSPRIQVIRPAFLSPKLMQPRASRLTTSPEDPSRVYSTLPPVAVRTLVACAAVVPACYGFMPPRSAETPHHLFPRSPGKGGSPRQTGVCQYPSPALHLGRALLGQRDAGLGGGFP